METDRLQIQNRLVKTDDQQQQQDMVIVTVPVDRVRDNGNDIHAGAPPYSDESSTAVDDSVKSGGVSGTVGNDVVTVEVGSTGVDVETGK
ncbi:hypothetical protein HDU76_006410 [Blyttiomyces sp. JEL0837]|nr:hypothetical protein HDU76_006410 [Blyttiomyces sp. JEL0837]